jgi:class 3 adenylate cyclase
VAASISKVQAFLKLGDGLTALFGYPIARENDAERAARAALAIQDGLAASNAAHAERANLNSRRAWALLPAWWLSIQNGKIYGDVPTVAARVQALAEPGGVLTTADVQRQLAGFFFVEDRGTYELRGLPAPVALYRLVRQSGATRRLSARNLTPLAKLVGREEELATLAKRWKRAQRGIN